MISHNAERAPNMLAAAISRVPIFCKVYTALYKKEILARENI